MATHLVVAVGTESTAQGMQFSHGSWLLDTLSHFKGFRKLDSTWYVHCTYPPYESRGSYTRITTLVQPAEASQD